MAMLAQLCVLRAVRREPGPQSLAVRIYRRRRLPPEIERWAAALGVAIQHIDGQAARGPALDARYQALMQEAYGT